MINPNISIGPLTFHLYGAIIAVAIYLGWNLVKKRAQTYKIPTKIFDDLALLIPLFLAIIGARLYHILHFWPLYWENPAQIIKITAGGLGIWGALAGIILGLWIFAKIKKINFFSLLDLSAPSILLGQAIGRIGNYINQEGFGPPTELPWGVYIDPQHRPVQYLNSTHFHPTFFYEAALDLIFFLFILKIAGKFKQKGQVFGLYLIFYALSRFIAEFWRTDTWTVGSIKIAHILSIVAFALGIWFFLIRPSKSLTTDH